MLEVKNTSDHPDLISAKALRLTIGVLGFLLPLVLIVGAALLQGCDIVQNSISAYYHTVMRNFLVGTLCAVAICFFVYQGYSKVDAIAGKLASIFALGVAWFPTSVGRPFTDCLPVEITNGITSKLHFISSGLLFLILAFFCLFLFTKHKEQITQRKKIRNSVYRICGFTILACIALIAIYFAFLSNKFPDLPNYRPVFYLEAMALIAFSISWLTKGEAIFGDL